MGRLIQSKKGQEVYSIIILVAFAFFAFTAIGRAGQTQKDLPEIGKLPTELISTYNQAEKDLTFIDQAALYSAYKSAEDLAINGGFTKLGSKCGTYQNYNIWKQGCFPEYENNFKAYFDEYFNPYLRNYPNRDLSNDYTIQLVENKVLGTPKNKINYVLSAGNYFTIPSFSITMDHEIDQYQFFIFQAEDLIKKCKTESKPSCIEQNLPEKWELGSCEGDQTSTNTEFRFCIKEESYPKQLTYKFAISFQ